jgi:hypothetical protein
MQDDAPSSLPLGLWGGANYPGVVNVGINAPGKNVVGNLTWTISPRIVNEVEFAYSQGTISGALSGAANSSSILSTLTNNLANPDPYGRIPSVSILDNSVTGVSQGSAPYFERNLEEDDCELSSGVKIWMACLYWSSLKSAKPRFNRRPGIAGFSTMALR